MELEYNDDGWRSMNGEVTFLQIHSKNIHQVSCCFDSTTHSHVLSWIDNKTSLYHSELTSAGIQVWDEETLFAWRKEVEDGT